MIVELKDKKTLEDIAKFENEIFGVTAFSLKMCIRDSRKEGCSEGVISDWGEVVTRYPYGNVRMDHVSPHLKRVTSRSSRLSK